MALNKAITNQFGVTTNYHKVRQVELRKIRRNEIDEKTNEKIAVESYTLNVDLFSYVSADVRAVSEAYAADRRSLFLTATLEEGDSTPCFTLAYNKIKSDIEGFEDAEDC